MIDTTQTKRSLKPDLFCTVQNIKLHSIWNTIETLDASLKHSRNLENEQWLRYSALKTQNKHLMDDLRKANKNNKNMLNLFRQSVIDSRLGNGNILPDTLKKEVQRIWQYKYDSLLTCNEQLKKQIATANSVIREKDEKINSLQAKLVQLTDSLLNREETVINICTKYLNLKRKKDEQEDLLMKYVTHYDHCCTKTKRKQRIKH